MIETIQLAHLPDNLELLVAYFEDVENAAFLKEQLLASNQDFNYAFIDATTVLSRKQLLAGCFRALNDSYHDRLKSNNVHAEIVFSLSPNNNIGDAFRRFGIQDSSKNVIAVKVPGTANITAESVDAHLTSAIQGQSVPLTDDRLRSICDVTRLRKTYKISSQQNKKQVNGATSPAIDDFAVLEAQVVGMMALRGAT